MAHELRDRAADQGRALGMLPDLLDHQLLELIESEGARVGEQVPDQSREARQVDQIGRANV